MNNLSRAAAVLLLLSSLLWAQADRGSITGTVIDASGAVVPAVPLSLRNAATNLTYSTSTNDNGSYSFLNLPVGTYTLSVEKKGFQRQEITGIEVQVNQQAKIDLTMRVGEVTQTVEVAASAAMVQTESTDVGTVINDTRFLDLPLTLGGGIRNPSAFIFLAPGVSGNSWEKHVGGGGSFNDQVYFDGIALSRGDLSNDAEVNPSVDAIAEYKLITNNYSAEYSHALAGVTSYTMKSGTNDFHGDAFEFNDNNHFDARGFFSPTKAFRNQNEYGFTLGGPIIIPKIYNGRNKTFFFVSYDQFNLRGGTHRFEHDSYIQNGAGRFQRMAGRDLRSADYHGEPRRVGIPNSVCREHYSEVAVQLGEFQDASFYPATDTAGTDEQHYRAAWKSVHRPAIAWFQDRSRAF